jgi:hypothetical protein
MTEQGLLSQKSHGHFFHRFAVTQIYAYVGAHVLYLLQRPSELSSDHSSESARCRMSLQTWINNVRHEVEPHSFVHSLSFTTSGTTTYTWW